MEWNASEGTEADGEEMGLSEGQFETTTIRLLDVTSNAPGAGDSRPSDSERAEIDRDRKYYRAPTKRIRENRNGFKNWTVKTMAFKKKGLKKATGKKATRRRICRSS
jgi:hypothetical protein